MSRRTLPGTTVALVVALVFGAGVGAASVTVLNVGPSPISAAEGELSESNELTVAGVENVYVGTNVTAVDVTVNDSDDTTASRFTVHLTVEDENGGVLESIQLPDQTTSGSSTVVRVDLTGTYSVSELSRIDVVVEAEA